MNTTTTQKITKAMRFTEMKSIFEDMGREDLVKFCTHELELLAKKSSGGERKMSATQKINEDIKTSLYAEMEVGKPYTITQMIKELPSIAPFTSQKIRALVGQLMNAGMVVRSETKGIAYFTKS